MTVTPGPWRPGPPPGSPRPGPRPAPPRPAPVDTGTDATHPAVDAALQAIINAADLSAADQIAHYEAAYQTLQETLATIDQA
ncbi:hypothetical protein V6U90_26375 [Micromonospora sp. CPCC 206060]|uniref:hypothetical protein n=1 Tax=Micromonospora sp. CPCC 206060 TaxID=3122406 RepID=UPI002FF12800